MSVPHVEVGLRQGRVFVIPKYSPGKGTYVDKEPRATKGDRSIIDKGRRG